MDSHYFNGTTFYTSQSSVDLALWATETSSYLLEANNTAVQSWTWAWDYETNLTVPLLWPGSTFQFQASFTNNNNERVQSNTLMIQKDTTPPAIVDQLSVQVGEVWWNTWIMVSRDPSSDFWAGLSWYHVVFASDSSLISTVQFTTTNWPLIIDSALIPAWYTTIQIVAFDNVWNSSRSTPSQFSFKSSSWNSSSVWNSPSPSQDSLPNSSNSNEFNINWNEDETYTPTTPSHNISDTIPTLVFQDSNETKPFEIPDSIWNKFIVPLSPFPINADTQYSSPSISSSNANDTITLDLLAPTSWVWWIWWQAFICSDEQCVEIKNTWETCSELLCLDLQPEMLHSIATSDQEKSYALLIAYHKDLQRKISYMKILLYYILCYDIELHLRRYDAFFKEIVIIFDK